MKNAYAYDRPDKRKARASQRADNDYSLSPKSADLD